LDAIQAPKQGPRIMRYELTDFEWVAIRSFLPNKPRGIPRVDDRRVLAVSFGACAQALPGATCRRPMVPARLATIASFAGGAGVWDRIMDALAAGHDAAVQMIDTSVVRVHQHGACVADNNHQDMGRSRGGLTSKIHAVVDTNGLPVHLALTPGEAHENRAVFGSSPRLASTNNVIRGPRIRCRLDQGTRSPAGSMGKHSPETKSQRPDLLQPVSVPRAQLNRTVIQQDQAMSASRPDI
jgi:transposase